MNIEELRSICMALPSVTEDIKWGQDLCFLIADKMFCVTGLEEELKVSLKVSDVLFEEYSIRPGIMPAPYMARHKWVLIQDVSLFSLKEWEKLILDSYTLVRSKLPKKTLAGLS